MKSFLKWLLSRDFAVNALLACAHRSLTVINYHRIGNPSAQCSVNQDLIGPDPRSFEQQIGFIKKHTHPLREADLLHCLACRQPFPAKSTLVTFDDAYKDNFEIAAPILKRFRVPALFFFPTQFISERKLGWWDQIAWQMRNSQKRRLCVGGKNYDLRSSEHSLVTRELVDWYKELPGAARPAFLAEIAAETGISEVPRAIADRQLMTWAEAAKLADYGIGVGAHTVSHPFLSSLSGSQQLWELVESKRAIEERLGLKVRSLAYPGGGQGDFNEETKSLAASAGYALAFTLIPGSNRLSTFDPYAIRRVSAPKAPNSLRTLVTFPSLVGTVARRRLAHQT